MLLEFKGDHSNDEGLCSSQQKRSVAALGILTIIFTGLIIIAFTQSRINNQLMNSDLNYENGLYFGILADINLDNDQNETHCRTGNSLNGKWIAHYPNSYGIKHCDSTFTHLNMTILQLKEIEDKTGSFEFILVIGDQVGRWIEGSKPSLDSIKKVHNLISFYFPSTPVYMVLGNHDLASFHSILPGQADQWYALLSQGLAPSFHTTESLKIVSAAETFSKYGFYKVEHDSSLWVIALNSQVFHNDRNATAEVIDAQFNWLNETLLRAELQKTVSVLLIGHVAPELKFIDLIRWDSNKNVTWKSDCVTRFNDIVGRFSRIIKLSFFAHQHTDSWYVGRSPSGGYVSHFLMPSVSPASRGHPSFSVGVTNAEWDLLDLLYYHSPVEQFTRTDQTPRYFFQYSFKEQNFYHDQKYSVIDGTLLDGLTKKIIDFEDGLKTYTARLMNTYQYRYKPHISPYQMYCVLTENTSDGLNVCLKKYSF